MGARGKVDQVIKYEILQQPYFQHNIPETTGREVFGESTSEVCERMLSEGASPEKYFTNTVTRIDHQRGSKLHLLLRNDLSLSIERMDIGQIGKSGGAAASMSVFCCRCRSWSKHIPQ